ncbi:MAG: hypothetical protein GY778_29405, partial [bacterium]|nr:hypothetical protein [bacterium]
KCSSSVFFDLSDADFSVVAVDRPPGSTVNFAGTGNDDADGDCPDERTESVDPPPGATTWAAISKVTLDGITIGATSDVTVKSGNEIVLTDDVAVDAPFRAEVTPTTCNSAVGVVDDLRSTSPSSGSVRLRWSAPDLEGSSVLAYDVRYATRRLRASSWGGSDVTVVPAPTPAQPGVAEELVVSGLDPDITHYFAIRSSIGDGVWSELSNIAAGSTLPVMSGRDIFVSPSGNASGAGTAADPLATVAAACSTSVAGDVVRVLAGTYPGDRCSVRSGTAIVSEDGPGRAVIDGQGQVDHLIAIWGDDDVVIDGFELHSSGGGSDGNDIIWIDGRGSGNQSTNIKLRQLFVHDAGDTGDCIKVTNYVDGFLLENSRLHSAWGPPSGGPEELLDMKLTRNAAIRYNWFYHLPGSNQGAMAYSKTDSENIVFDSNVFGPQSSLATDSALGTGWSSSTSGYNTIGLYVRNNIFFEAHYSAVGAYGAKDEYVVNNVFFNCGRGGGGILRVQEGGSQDDSDNVQLFNNIVIDSEGQLPDRIVYRQSIAQLTGFSAHDNLYWNAGNAIPSGGYHDPNGEAGFINADPLLANPGVPPSAELFDAILDRFLPAASSPAVDAGSDASGAAGVVTDVLGAARPQTSAYDRGCHEQ